MVGKKGRPRTESFWEDRAFTIFADQPWLSNAKVATALQQIETELGHLGAPSERTVGRLRHRFESLSDQVKRSFRLVVWPETFINGDLPWESSPAVFSMLRSILQTSSERPSVRLALWYWRLDQIRDQVPQIDVGVFAFLLSQLERDAQRKLGDSAIEAGFRSLERFLLGLEGSFEVPSRGDMDDRDRLEMATDLVAALHADGNAPRKELLQWPGQ